MMPRRAFALALPALLALATGASAQQAPAPPPEPHPPVAEQLEQPEPQPSLAEVKLKESLAAAAEAAQYPRINAKDISDVLQLTLRDKDLHLDSALPPTDQSVVTAPRLDGLTKVALKRAGERSDAPVMHFSLQHVDFSSPAAVSVHTSVQQPVPGRLHLNQDISLLVDEVHTVQLIQNTHEIVEDEPRVRLYVQITGADEVNIRREADNIIELRRRFPAEVAKYVDPIFVALRQDGLLAKVDPKLAWQVFADAYNPPADLVTRVSDLVKQLDSENFQDREAASKALEALGQPAALTLQRMDRAAWSEEQVGRVDAFLAKFKTADDARARKLRADPDFLLDCLYSDDEPIRRRALAELQKLTGRQIDFDLSASPQQRLAAIARLREAFGATPSTQARLRAE